MAKYRRIHRHNLKRELRLPPPLPQAAPVVDAAVRLSVLQECIDSGKFGKLRRLCTPDQLRATVRRYAQLNGTAINMGYLQ